MIREAGNLVAGMPTLSNLSPEHQREIIEESANRPDVAAARGWWTASRRSEVPEAFPKWQRRVGLVGPWYSPDGETVSYQLKAKKRRTLQSGKLAAKYESAHGAPQIIDVHPFMREAIKDVRRPLWITEGLKTGDSLTSRGRCTVVIPGVWNFAIAETESKVLLPCWDHVPLEGRTVYAGYDADSRTNADVQEALSRLVARLGERGARVLVAYPPPVNGDHKAGIDDYLAAGGDVEELERSARPFVPVDVARERLNAGGPFADSIGELWVRWDTAEWPGRGGDTDRAIEKALIRFAEKRGKLVKGGVRVEASHREIAESAGVSTMAPARSIPRLEARGRVKLDNANRERSKRGAFVLPISPKGGARYCIQYGRIVGSQGDEKKEKDNAGSDFSPLSNAEYSHRAYTSARPLEDVPEFRHPTIRFSQEQDKRGRSVKVGEYVSRPGKRRGAMVEYLARRGGSAEVPDLMARYASPKTRKRDFKRLQLSYLEGWRRERGGQWYRVGPPIVRVDGDTVSLVEGWREAVKIHRELTGEIDVEALDATPQKDGQIKPVVLDGDDTRQRKKHARQREAFRRRHEYQADPDPEMPQVDDLRHHWSVHPEPCACRDCEERFGRVVGEHSEGCRCASCYSKLKRAASLNNPNRRVVPLQPRKRPEQHAPPEPEDLTKPHPAAVVELRPEKAYESKPATATDSFMSTLASENKARLSQNNYMQGESVPDRSPPPDDWLNHYLSCECSDCTAATPTYARLVAQPVGGRA